MGQDQPETVPNPFKKAKKKLNKVQSVSDQRYIPQSNPFGIKKMNEDAVS